ncbi:MAG: hypothetical protein JWN40_3020 [Phycisphaerales bacterium]|nr:hypothetical protein [Phycisphaerales bacterium]
MQTYPATNVFPPELAEVRVSRPAVHAPGERWLTVHRRCAWAIVFLAIAVRVPLYLVDRSLWGDEASLAVNVVGRSFGELCRPLAYEQGAPLGFLFIERAAVMILGVNEFALRLAPLACGIAAVLLLFALVRQFLDPRTGLAALGIMALAKSPVHYSAELKQYSSDTVVSLLIALCALRLVAAAGDDDNRNTARAVAWFGLAGAILAWFSHPAVFVILGAGIVVTAGGLRQRRPRFAVLVAAATIVGASSAALHYYLFARSLAHDDYLLNFWSTAMVPLDSPRAALPWLLTALPRSLKGLFGVSGIWLGTPLFIIGCIALARGGRRALLGLCLAPAMCVLAASVLHKYPFEGRLLLFLLPLYAIVVAAGLDMLWRQTPSPWRWAAPLTLSAILAEPAAVAIKGAIKPPLKEDCKPALEYLVTRCRATDAIYVPFAARPAFEFYAPRYGLDHMPALLGERGKDSNFIRGEASRLAGRERVWAFWVTTDPAVDMTVSRVLGELGTPLADAAAARNVKVRLFNLDPRAGP